MPRRAARARGARTSAGHGPAENPYVTERAQDESDDWAPLAADAPLHPGEQVDVKSAPATAASAAASTGREPPRDAAADAAMRALHAKLAKLPPSRSLVTQVMRREQRPARRSPPKPLAPSGTAPVSEPFAPPAEFIESPAAVTEQPWFRGLPQAEQERLQQAWACREQRLEVDTPWRKRERNRRSMLALGVFAAVTVLGGSRWWLVMGAGGLTAAWWRHRQPDRIGDPVTATICFYVASAISAAFHGGLSPSLVFDSILVVALGALVGIEGEMRSSGGFVAMPRPDELQRPPPPPPG